MSDSNMFPGVDEDSKKRSIENDAERIEQSAESIESKVYASKKLAPFFQVEVSIKVFGHEIWHWIFPPEKS